MAREGSTVNLPTSGRTGRVMQLIGEGGQGSVYELTTDDGERLALKWYHDHTATPFQRFVISELIERGSPNDRFLWPLELVTESGKAGFGYVMELRPARFVGLAALLDGAVDASLSVVCATGYQLADSYFKLHAEGLCYRDISFGNVFFDPSNGDVLICDNDNVGLDGESPSNVLGTRRFMAPEIVRKQARPSCDTDLYSLSVLLFYLLMVGHPLMGSRELTHPIWNEAAELDLFGENPTFIFDPDNNANGPIPGVHDSVISNWNIYPLQLQRKFCQAFTRGLADAKNGRVRESEWRAELVRCRDLLRPCSRCGASNFFDQARPRHACWNCSLPLAPPLCLFFDRCTVVLNEATEVTGHHVGMKLYEFEHKVARVSRHPLRPGSWGLTNVGASTWTAAMTDGTRHSIEPGQSLGLVPGMKIQFGRAVGRIDLAVHADAAS